MTQSTLLITFAQPNPENIDAFMKYVGAATELAVRAGGEVSSRFALRHRSGDAPASVFGFATFPTATAITGMFESPEYQELIPLREQGLTQVNAYIVEEPPVTTLASPAGVYLVTLAELGTPTNGELQTYQEAAQTLVGRHSGRAVARFQLAGQPVGSTPASLVTVTEFPSEDQIESMFSDPDYVAIEPTRDRAISSLSLYVTTS